MTKQFTQNMLQLILNSVPNTCELFSLQHTVYKLALPLPITLPLNEIKGLTPLDGLVSKIQNVLDQVVAGNTLRYF